MTFSKLWRDFTFMMGKYFPFLLFKIIYKQKSTQWIIEKQTSTVKQITFQVKKYNTPAYSKLLGCSFQIVIPYLSIWEALFCFLIILVNSIRVKQIILIYGIHFCIYHAHTHFRQKFHCLDNRFCFFCFSL